MEAEVEELQAPIQPYNYWFSNPGVQRRIHNVAFDKPYEVYNRSLYETFKENRVNMLTIVGPVDDRTCAWCDEYVGRNFRVGQFLPTLPNHVGCRHSFAPVIVMDKYGRKQLAPWLKST